MEIIIHRINTVSELKIIKPEYGVEIDIRTWGSDLVLNHEPFQNGEKLEDYLDEYQHGTLVLNIKEDGIEDDVLQLVRQRSQIKSYFLLDVEFPYLFRASRQGERDIAIRFSEDEGIETVKKYVGMVDWVWIDTNTRLPITSENKEILNHFKKCLVCPSRWHQGDKINDYLNIMFEIRITIDAVMTSTDNISHYLF